MNTETSNDNRSIVFDRAVEYYDETRGLPPEVSERIAALIASLVPDKNASILEVGVGTGRIALPLVRQGLRVTGVDLSLPMMRVFQSKLTNDAERTRTSLLRADATSLPFRDGSFAVALEVHVLHLIPRWRDALTEVRRCLQTGGVFLHAHHADQYDDAIESAPSPWSEVRAKWREIVREMGYYSNWVGIKTDAEQTDALNEVSRELTELPAVRWTATETYAARFASIRDRKFSDTWRVPDDIFQESIKRLHAWLLETHKDADEPRAVQKSFRLFAARF